MILLEFRGAAKGGESLSYGLDMLANVQVGEKVAESVAGKLFDILLAQLGVGYPLRTYIPPALHPASADFLIGLRNRTAAPVRLDRVILRAFGRSSFFQPIDLEVLSPGVSEWSQLKDGAVPAYSLSMIVVRSPLLVNRVMSARKLRFEAIEGTKPVWHYTTSTRWIRKAITQESAEAAVL
jgi:hypothetical protein